MKFRLKRLNQQGFDHILVLVVFIVLFGAVGSYLLVESHAAASTYVVKSTVNPSDCLTAVGSTLELESCNGNAGYTTAQSSYIGMQYDQPNSDTTYNVDTISIGGKCMVQQSNGSITLGGKCNSNVLADDFIMYGSRIVSDVPQWSINMYTSSQDCAATNQLNTPVTMRACTSAYRYNSWSFSEVASLSPGPVPAPSSPTGTSATSLPSSEYCVSYEFYYEEPNAWGTQCVKDIQQMIYNIGEHHDYSSFVSSEVYPPDGKYGSNTGAQVKAFQNHVGFSKADQDGVVGANTWAKLCSYVNLTPGTWVYTNVGCTKNKFGDARYPL